MLDKQALLEQDLHDLKLRFELLEGDRKAYYEQSQLSIQANKDEIVRLRNQNKDLRAALAQLKKTSPADRGAGSGGSMAHPAPRAYPSTELEKLDQHINEVHKKADDMTALVRAKQTKLDALKDQLRDLEQEVAVVRATAAHSPQAHSMRHLENQLDKAVIKYHETQALRKVYEEMVRRLHEERQLFDAQLATMERTLAAKRADAAELEHMARDAHHAKDLARAELARIETQIAEDRKRREKDLVAQRELVRLKLEASEKLELQLLADTNRASAAAAAAEFAAGPAGANQAAHDAADALAERVVEYEALIRHIKEATGVDDLSKVVAKFEEQRDTKARLSDLAKQHETRLAQLRAQRAQLLKELDEALVTGEQAGAAAKQAMRAMEHERELEAGKYRDVVERHERMARILADLKRGVVHLWDKIKDDKTQKTEVPDTGIVGVLEQSIGKINALLQSVEGKDIVIEGDLSAIPMHMSQHNTRVRLVPAAFESEDDDSDNGAQNGENGKGGPPGAMGAGGVLGNQNAADEDVANTVVPDRDAIKKATMALLNARNKAKGGRKKKRGKDSKGGDDDDDVSD
ncbi:hypothetical protein GGF32_006333 [Allomyces javanicus]|nr:hypothetical protein GGF32_006333 [Allomyces javanicus]